MKEFYVLNLDARRIAIVAGGALSALGLALIIGMALGRGQGERAARIASEEAQTQKLGLASEVAKSPLDQGEKLVIAQGPNTLKPLPEKPGAPAVKSEVELREDPMVQGPPKKRSKQALHKTRTGQESDDAPVKQPRRKKALAKAKISDDAEVSGRVDHSSTSLTAGASTTLSKRETEDGRSTGSSARRRKQKVADADDESPAPKASAGKKRTKRSGDDADAETASANGVSRYTIQVAAFKRSSEASGLIDKLKGEGIKAQYEKNGDFYLVTVGRTKSKEKLTKALSRLKELEYDAYIRRLRSPSSET